MIQVTRFDGKEIHVNAELILTVERTPDTLITLTTGDKIIVQESVDRVVSAFKRYKAEVAQGPRKEERL